MRLNAPRKAGVLGCYRTYIDGECANIREKVDKPRHIVYI